MRCALSLVMTVLVAAVLVIALMLLLASRDESSLDRSGTAAHTATTP
jgi:hypothetical protein